MGSSRSGGPLARVLTDYSILSRARGLKPARELISCLRSSTYLLLLCKEPLHLVIVELLLERGTDANAQNDSGQTALHLASREGHRDAVQFLHLSGV
jgi:Ankyrin repeats (many copies)